MPLTIEQIYGLIGKNSVTKTAPESARLFSEKYIATLYEKDEAEGAKFEDSYSEVICDYQRDGFTAGFKAAAQLIISSLAE